MCLLQLEKRVEEALAKEKAEWDKERGKFMSKIKRLQKKGRKKGKKGENDDDEDDAGAGGVVAGVSVDDLEKIFNQLMDKKLKTIKKMVLQVQSSCLTYIRPAICTIGLFNINSALCRGRRLSWKMISRLRSRKRSVPLARKRSRPTTGSWDISTSTTN